MSLFLLALLGFGLLAIGTDLFDTDGDDAVSEPSEPPEPPDDPDIGASVIEQDGVVTVELGEDETGSLAMVTHVVTEDFASAQAEYHEARLYLLPEGAEIPEGDATAFEAAGLPAALELEQLEEALDLQLLAHWDLGAELPIDDAPFTESTLVEPPEILTEDPLSYYQVSTNADTDEIASIRALEADGTPAAPHPVVYTVNGTTEVLYTNGGAVHGTDADESFVTESGTFTLRGNGGDDTISVYGGSVYGGPGDDVLENDPDGGPVALRGSRGDDLILAHGSQAVGMGGLGDDVLHLQDGAEGLGGDGSDVITVHQGGGTGFGGDGDDRLVAALGPTQGGDVVFTGGAGADTFALAATDPADSPGQGEVVVTDFDPAEDLLQIENADAILDIRILVAAGSETRVEIDIAAPDEAGAPRDETLRFRLAGTPAITEAHVVLAQPLAA